MMNDTIATIQKRRSIRAYDEKQIENEEEVKEILKEDPFSCKKIAEYEIVEFSPTKYEEGFEKFITA